MENSNKKKQEEMCVKMYAFIQVSVLITVLTLTDMRLDLSSDMRTPMTDILMTDIPVTDVPMTDYDAATDIAVSI